VSNGNDQTSSSIYSFTNLKTGNQNANLNAKKLDVDFGGDDFFDSFGMAENEPISTKPSTHVPNTASDNPFAVATSEPAPGRDESGPFQLGVGINTNSKEAGHDDDFVKNKLKELEGK
jgi:hypothetical protein